MGEVTETAPDEGVKAAKVLRAAGVRPILVALSPPPTGPDIEIAPGEGEETPAKLGVVGMGWGQLT